MYIQHQVTGARIIKIEEGGWAFTRASTIPQIKTTIGDYSGSIITLTAAKSYTERYAAMTHIRLHDTIDSIHGLFNIFKEISIPMEDIKAVLIYETSHSSNDMVNEIAKKIMSSGIKNIEQRPYSFPPHIVKFIDVSVDANTGETVCGDDGLPLQQADTITRIPQADPITRIKEDQWAFINSASITPQIETTDGGYNPGCIITFTAAKSDTEKYAAMTCIKFNKTIDAIQEIFNIFKELSIPMEDIKAALIYETSNSSKDMVNKIEKKIMSSGIKNIEQRSYSFPPHIVRFIDVSVDANTGETVLGELYRPPGTYH
jgi:hypothetical protein